MNVDDPTAATTSGTAAEVRGDPHDIDGPWLTEALEAAGVARGAQVLDVAFGGFIGTGQSARSARLHLTWSDPDGRPASLVGKFPSDDETARMFQFMSGTYFKEWIFYDQLADTVDVRSPVCHVARFDSARSDFVLLMEDIAGSSQGDHLDGLTVDQVALAVEESVGLHAPRFGDASLEPVLFQNQPVSSAAEGGAMAQMIYQGTLPNFFDRFGARLDDDVRDLVERLGPKVARWFEGTDTPSTLVHMDYRSDNFLFGQTPADPPIVVVDYQSLGYGCGATDLAYVIGGSFPDQSLRARVERDLVEDYRTRMAAAGVDLPAEALWRDYRHGSMWGVLMAVLASMSTQTTERGEELFVAMTQGHGRHALDLDALALLE